MRYNCTQCDYHGCYDCFCKYHKEKNLFKHRFYCILNNEWVTRFTPHFAEAVVPAVASAVVPVAIPSHVEPQRGHSQHEHDESK
jgi:hypothetical protein